MKVVAYWLIRLGVGWGLNVVRYGVMTWAIGAVFAAFMIFLIAVQPEPRVPRPVLWLLGPWFDPETKRIHYQGDLSGFGRPFAGWLLGGALVLSLIQAGWERWRGKRLFPEMRLRFWLNILLTPWLAAIGLGALFAPDNRMRLVVAVLLGFLMVGTAGAVIAFWAANWIESRFLERLDEELQLPPPESG